MRIDLSRRSFLATAGSAATLPAVALAAPDRIPADPMQLSDKDQLEFHMAEAEKLLCRMHPLTVRPSHSYESRADGTYMASFSGGHREWLSWDGAGLYRISDDGCLVDYWIEAHQLRGRDGRVQLEQFKMTRWYEGEYIDLDYPRYGGRAAPLHRPEAGRGRRAMVNDPVYTDTTSSALETASILRTVVFAIDSLEDGLSNTPHVHALGDLRRVVEASAKRIDDLAEYLDKIECGFYGTKRA